MNINKLKENEYIKFVPQANTSPWEFELDKDKKPYFPFVESQAYIDIHVDILLCDYDSDEDYIEKIGYANLALINSHVFEETTFMHVDCDDGQLSDIMEEMDYANIEDSYMDFNLIHPYAPFMILRNLHVDKEYRRMGIGKSIIQFAHEYIGSLFNLKLNLVIWEIAYYNKTTDGDRFTQADYDANIAFSKAVGGEIFSTYNHSTFFFYNEGSEKIDEDLIDELLEQCDKL